MTWTANFVRAALRQEDHKFVTTETQRGEDNRTANGLPCKALGKTLSGDQVSGGVTELIVGLFQSVEIHQ